MTVRLLERLDLKFEIDRETISKTLIQDSEEMQSSTKGNRKMITKNNQFHDVTYLGDLSDDWVAHGGKLLKKQLPWYNNWLQIIKGLQYDGVSYQKHSKPIFEHADIRTCNSDNHVIHELEPDRQCKINYIVYAENPENFTTVTDRNDPSNFKTYKSIPHVAWLLNINHLHKLECHTFREVLSFRFCENIDTVFNHFNRLGPLTFK